MNPDFARLPATAASILAQGAPDLAIGVGAPALAIGVAVAGGIVAAAVVYSTRGLNSNEEIQEQIQEVKEKEQTGRRELEDAHLPPNSSFFEFDGGREEKREGEGEGEGDGKGDGEGDGEGDKKREEKKEKEGEEKKDEGEKKEKEKE